jgi:uncharacterized protein YkwD
MSRGTRRVRFLLPGALVLAVLCDGGCSVASSTPAPGTASASSPAGSQAGLAVAASPTVVTRPPHPATPSAHKSTAQPSPSRSASSSSPRPPTSSTATTHPAAPATTSRPATPASSSASQNGTAAAQVLGLINQARASAGLPALTVTSGLNASSAAHNMVMAGGCGLSHQCPGEAALGDRETAAGVHWTSAGENIGEGGPVADTSTAIAQMATGLTQSMLKEKPPDDGHRMNILSSSFTHIGIAVYRDGGGTVWLTQDFSN